MTEFAEVAQEKDGYRRLFVDEDMELYVWYERRGGPIQGFQLCYDKKRDQRAITFKEGRGFLHSAIDDGEKYGGAQSVTNATPILIEDGPFPAPAVAERFEARAKSGVPAEIRDYVLEAFRLFRPELINPFL